MFFEKVNGNTYYINAPTNIGVYVFKNKNCIIIDTGINSSQARKIDDFLKENNLHPKYIVNTHSHCDHCGGNKYFTETYPGCQVFTSETEKIYMEHMDLDLEILYSSSPLKEFSRNIKSLNVDFILNEGENKINDEKFNIVNLEGHNNGQIGFITSDRVCFLGDSVFSNEIMEKYKMPYLFNLEKFENSLERIKNIDCDKFILGHSEKVFDKLELLKLIDRNINNINSFKEQIIELLEQPLSREDILENLVVLNDMPMNFKQYHLYFSAISAFIKYLYDKDLLNFSIENGRLYYYSVKN